MQYSKIIAIVLEIKIKRTEALLGTNYKYTEIKLSMISQGLVVITVILLQPYVVTVLLLLGEEAITSILL